MPHLDNFDNQQMTLPAGGDLAAYARVKLNTAGAVVAAGPTDPAIGTVDERGAVNGQYCGVRLLGLPHNFIAAGAIEVGDICWAAASGKVNDVDAGSARVAGIALTAAGADGDELTLLMCDYVS